MRARVGLLALLVAAAVLVAFLARGARRAGSLASIAPSAPREAVVPASNLEALLESEGSARVSLLSVSDRVAASSVETGPRDGAIAGVGPTVRGSLVDPEGKPILDARIRVRARCADHAERVLDVPGDGSFEIPSLRPGDWSIGASGPGWSESTRLVTITRADGLRQLDLVLEPKPLVRIHVVTPDGKPFSEALGATFRTSIVWRLSAVAARLPFPERSPTGVGAPFEQLGRFWRLAKSEALPASCIGELELAHAPPLHVGLTLGDAVLADQLVEGPGEDVTFVVDPNEFTGDAAGLRLRVVDATTLDAISDSEIHLRAVDGAARSSTTDADGQVTITPWPAGAHLLVVRAAGHMEAELEIDLSRGYVTDIGPIELEPVAPLRVRVLGADAIRDVRVHCLPVVDGDDRFRWSRRTIVRASDDGTFNVPIAPYEQVVWAAKPGLVTPRVRVGRQDAGTEIELALREPTLLTIRPNRRAERCTLAIHDEIGLPIDGPGVIEGAAVRYPLLPGLYELLVCRPGGLPERRSIEIGETAIEIPLD